MDKKPQVSVIIAVKNEAQNLPRLFRSLREQTTKSFEIIVVDNFSKDKTVKIAKQFTPKVFILGDERSQQRNFGAKKAAGNLLLFLDADMELPPTILEECVNKSTNSSAVGIIIPERVGGTSFFAKIKRLEKKFYEGESLIEAPRFFVRYIFQKIGGYNEELIAAEDWDMAQRIKQRGRIDRISTPLIHYENSFWRDVEHKIYYVHSIHKYIQLHPDIYKKQSGRERIWIFLKKPILLMRYPFTSLCLLLYKLFQYGLFKFILIYNHVLKHKK